MLGSERPTLLWPGHNAWRATAMTACAVPLLWLCWAAATDGLGPNPAEALIRGLGDWTLRGLCATLAITPLRRAFGWAFLARWRRGLGLWTWAYASLHALAYAWLDMGWLWSEVAADVVQRPFIAVGALAGLLLWPLAATSFNRAIRALGATHWQALHRVVYVVAVLALLHFYWMRAGKHDFAEVHLYAALLGGLGAWRVWAWWRARGLKPGAAPGAAGRRGSRGPG